MAEALVCALCSKPEAPISGKYWRAVVVSTGPTNAIHLKFPLCEMDEYLYTKYRWERVYIDTVVAAKYLADRALKQEG